MHIPYNRLFELIKEQASISDEDLTKKVQAKFDEFSGLISQEGALHVVAHDLGVSITEEIEKPFTISELEPNLKGVKVKAKVIRKYPISVFERDGNQGKVGSMLIGDESGTTRLTFWHEQTDLLTGFDENTVYQFEHVSSRTNQGRVELTYTQSSKFEKVDEDLQVAQRQAASFGEVTPLIDAKEGSQMTSVATVVQVFKPNKYVVDKTTNKKVSIQEGEFDDSIHAHAIVANIVIDDGTESMRTVFFREQAETLFAKSTEEIVAMRDNEVDFEKAKAELLGRIVKLSGRIVKNELYNRLECMAGLIDLDPNPKEL
jgi:ssDNA-binding replication factor A large subunit